MNYPNEEQIQYNNNRNIRGIIYNTNNLKIPKRKQKYKTENNNPEIVEFKSQDNLMLKKNLTSTQNFEKYLKKDKTKTQKQIYDSNNNIINRKISNKEPKIPQQSNKSNSSVKINTNVNCRKYFATKTSKKSNNNNNANEYFSKKTNYKERINSNGNISSSNKYNLISSGQNSIKINGNTMINNYNNNKNNQLTMTKSSIQIKGNFPLFQSQNIYHNQKQIESMEFNIEGNNTSRGKYNNKQNFIENNNNNHRFIQNKNINDENYKNKTHLIQKEQFTKINYDFDSNNISKDNSYNENSFNDDSFTDIYSSNIKENLENKKINNNNNYNTNNSYGNYNKLKNNTMKLTQLESISDKNINFVKNDNEYNNIFFYNSNTNDTNENSSNEEKYNFQCRNNDIMNDNKDYNKKNKNYINYYIKKKSNEISTNNIKDNTIKNKFIYQKSGNLSEKKLIKINSSNINSHIRVNDLSNNEQDIMQKTQNKIKGKINKNENIILKNKIKNEIKKYKDKNNYKYNNCDCIENKNKDINKNIIIKQSEIKNNIKNSYDIIDFKLKIPNKEKLDNNKEEIISINIKEGNLNEKIENIINNYSLDNSYFKPLLSLIENSINILNNVNDMKITKNNKIKLFKGNKDISSKDNSECNILNYSIILDLIDKKMYKEFLENIYYDIEEINENAKILNMSI